MDNAPYTVRECLQLQCAFIASRVGGIPEVIHPSDHAEVLHHCNSAYSRQQTLFEPNAAALHVKLARVLLRGLATVPRPAPALKQDIDAEWLKQIRTWLQLPSAPSLEPQVPLVTVCIPTRRRTTLLAQAVASLQQQQHYPTTHMQVIVVDDCSGDASADVLHSLARELKVHFHTTSIVVYNTRRRHDSGSRNACGDFAAGEYILFLDSDNVAKPDYVRRCGCGIGSVPC